MHDGGMVLFPFLLVFIANLCVGVYTLFLRSQIAGLRGVEEKCQKLEERSSRLESKLEHTASREAFQGIRGDLKKLEQKLDGIPGPTWYADISAGLKSLAAIERRLDRQDDFLHKVRSES